MESLKTKHWTSSTNGFVAKISADFVLQIEQKLDQEELSHAKFATLLNVTEGSVSQTLNQPPNFKLSTAVEYVRPLGLKVALIAYDDGDPNNERGPINPEIFYECWKRAGRPIDFFDLAGAPWQGFAKYQMDEGLSVSGLDSEWSPNASESQKKKSPQGAQHGCDGEDFYKAASL